jgi:hypothetical protein
MNLDLTNPVQTARFLVRLGIYDSDDIELTLVKDFCMSPDDAHVIVMEAVEFDKSIDA